MIIAVVPAPGHEALVAEGPMGERPATIVRHRGSWVPWPAPAIRSYIDTRPVACVLHAPGDPKLGMLRAQTAAGVGPNVRAFRCYDGPSRGQWWEHPQYYSDRKHAARADWHIPHHPFLGEPDLATGDYPHPGGAAFALAHLLLQRGIAAEVIVIEPADKAKE